MSDEDLIARVEGGVGRLTLNRPRALNALTADMCEAINAALLAWRAHARVTMVLIEGAGERAFCAGGDVRRAAESGAGDGVEAARFFRSEYRMNELLCRYPKPIVAIMDGITMGGGVGASLPARYRIATERTVWAMPEGDIGLFPDVGCGWHLPRLPGQTGVWAALTGARLNGADCRALGIATHFAPSERLEELRASLAADAGKDCDPGPGLAAACEEAGAASFAEHRAQIDRLFAFDAVEEILAALDADGSDWARAQAEILARKCPTTLKVSLRLLREGARQTRFAQEMALEYRLAVRMTRRHDFIDGVRAVLVDKDGRASWEPSRLEEVTSDQLDALFAPLPPEQEWTPLD